MPILHCMEAPSAPTILPHGSFDHLASGYCLIRMYGSTAKTQRPVQPALLLPLDDIGSVEFARAAGTSSTFDLLLHARDGSTHEARAWHRSTLASLPRVWKRLHYALSLQLKVPSST